MKESRAEKQRRLRIRLSVAAYAYEFEAASIISDAEFDRMCLEVDPMISTGRTDLDDFFENEFDPSTGVWIRSHPDLDGIRRIYERVWKP